MFFFMIAIVGLGFLMKYNLIPGKERFVKYGRNVELFFLGLDRHQWGTVHLVLGFILIGLLALHIILHWKTIIRVYRRLINARQSRKVIAFGFSILCCALLLLPFFLKPEIQELGKSEGHFARFHDVTSPEVSVSNDRSLDKAKPDEIYKHDFDSIKIAGSMTIDSVCIKYEIPRAHLVEKLALPANLTGYNKLGILRRKYGFRMSDVKRIIENYHAEKDLEILK